MKLADILGDPPDGYVSLPWRPHRGCPCCGAGLGWDDLVFCARCELHPAEWCRPLNPPLLAEPRKENAPRFPRLFESA